MAYMDRGKGLFVIISAIMVTPTVPKETPPILETCNMETFQARCSEDEVIVMGSALYGRMRPSDCAPINTGDYGCVAIALTVMDGECSGREECSVSVPNPALVALNPCPRGHTPYLETSYACVQAIPVSLHADECLISGVVDIIGYTEGILSSSAVYSSRLGSQLCAYSIRAEAGQYINITLVDFMHDQLASKLGGPQSTCHRYAALTDASGPTSTSVCRGTKREQHIYVSQSNEIQIQFADVQGSGAQPNFLIKFSVFGCANPDLLGNELVDRTAGSAVLYCKSTGRKQYIQCNADEWNEEVVICAASSVPIPKSLTSMQGLIITLVVGIVIGSIIGCILFCCVCACMKRYKREQPRQIVYYEGSSHWNAGNRLEPWNNTIQRQMTMTPGARSGVRKSHYEHVYDPIDPELTQMEPRSPPSRYNTLRRLEGQDLPLPPRPIEYHDDRDHAYDKPV